MNYHGLKAVASSKVLHRSLDFERRIQAASIRYRTGCSYHEPAFVDSFFLDVQCSVHVRVDDQATLLAAIQAPVDAICLPDLPAAGTRS